MAGLDGAMAQLERRFGAHAVVRGAVAERRAAEHHLATGTPFDRIAAGLAAGSSLAFVGEATSGKLTLAQRAAAGAQRSGGSVLWIDAVSSLDAAAAERSGVDLDRLIVVRTRTRDDALLAGAAALRGDGFRLVVVDTGPALAPGVIDADDVAPLLPLARGSTAALLVVSDRPAARLALPRYRFERIAWERRFGRTVGYAFEASAAGRAEGGERFRASVGVGSGLACAVAPGPNEVAA